MKRTFATLAAAFAALTLCSCGHNVTQYSKGVGFDIGMNPDTYMISITFRYGEAVTAVVKEKATVTYSGELKTTTTTTPTVNSGTETASATATAASMVTETSTGAKLTMVTGDQVTGYVVDLEEVKQKGKSNETVAAPATVTATAEEAKK